ncbi:WD40 repeat domain-containing protein [Saccharibacter sp. 17.LH.SD]|uniref:WD40 repeat domain-containing protein n=1 Tax=Saccharibacter sp. 17.LH.SD TaxID=2689393 RepID=UPI001371C630|nr:WD40 repeat domain-containing protein [Saccharibacter sp. 17.LH.SD]MXV43874.1 WD40 repeat domain-containing protein [Saccharibacter sp. 17.LH.SD]
MRKTLLETRGAERCFESPIVGVTATRDGTSLAAMTADGEAVLFVRDVLHQPDQWRVTQVHDGALRLVQDCHTDSFLSGGEDGRVVRFSAEGSITELYKGRAWIDCLASTTTHFAFSCKKEVMLRNAEGHENFKTLEHPSTVSGLMFDAKGRRLVASHYNGVSLWFVNSKESTARSLEWKGSHIGVCMHPGGEAVVSSMQENELHGWRLPDGHNMRMSGYPKQVHSMAFTRSGRWLATTGADAAVLWPFFGGGPMGKAPAELARLPGVFSTALSVHPKEDLLAIGYDDGTVLLAEIEGKEARVLPICNGHRSGGVQRGEITSLAFTPQGGTLIFGTEGGYVGAINLAA